MGIKEKLENLRRGLQNGDRSQCGDSPHWIQEEVLRRLDKLLEEPQDAVLESKAKLFVIGATRFVVDRCGSECDILLGVLSKIA
jgi:hypothetical protein